MLREKSMTNTSMTEILKSRSEGKMTKDLALKGAKSEEELEQNILSDPDSDIDDDWLNSDLIAHHRKKERITIRLDNHVLEHFRKMGNGYQTKINDVLNLYVLHLVK